ncbi:hypothetical protein SCHPADRAFT_861403, partial [Schizopora paradoxa]
MTKAGCSANQSGKLLNEIIREIAPRSGAAKETEKHEASARTVQRSNGEGGVAAKIQIGYEMMQAKSLTISGDATTHKKQNLESRHANYAVRASYSDEKQGETVPTVNRTRFLGVHTSVNHKAATQLEGWKNTVSDIADVTNRSPLLEKSSGSNIQHVFRMCEFTAKLVGVHSDHAEDQKAFARGALSWKLETSRASLGYTYIEELSEEDFIRVADEAQAEKISEVGEAKWDGMSSNEREKLLDDAISALAWRLGEEKYASLSAEEKKDFDLFLWVGCMMHKLLNAVKGGCAKFSSFWARKNLRGPLLLPNRDNDAALDSASSSLTAAGKRALEVSGGGAVKLTSLMGAYLKHRDDKKGEQDAHKAYMDFFSGISTFPDTSNTRYQSHIDAAAVIIAQLELYQEYMRHARDLKQNRNFNHMENNIYNALQDLPTQAELLVMVFYGEAVCYPYGRTVRNAVTDGRNALDMGPYHEQVIAFVKRLIETPEIILSPDADPQEAVMDGREWTNPEAVAIAQKLAPSFPYLRELFVDFCDGTLVTWQRFSAEFVTGGAIDSASKSNRERAWMPATNDANEGALGRYRVLKRAKVRQTLHLQNAQVMYNRNGTQDFMDAKLNRPQDEAFLRAEWRKVDSSKLTKRGNDEVVRANIATVEEKHEKDTVRAGKKAETQARLKAVGDKMVLEESEIRKMTLKAIRLQLQFLRSLCEDPEIPRAKDTAKKEAAKEALIAAMARY